MIHEFSDDDRLTCPEITESLLRHDKRVKASNAESLKTTAALREVYLQKKQAARKAMPIIASAYSR